MAVFNSSLSVWNTIFLWVLLKSDIINSDSGQTCDEFLCVFCFVVQSCQQLDAEGETKQKALWHNQNSALKLRQTSGWGEASPGKHEKKLKFLSFQSMYLDGREVTGENAWPNLSRPV